MHRRPEWSRQGDRLIVGYWDMARCSPASPGWRAYLLPHVAKILDDYGLDGLYNDCGYVTNARGRSQFPKSPDEVEAFEETTQLDGAFADLLQLIYAEVKRRGGVVKLHVDALYRPEVAAATVYDYLWVGEGVSNADTLRGDTDPSAVECGHGIFESRTHIAHQIRFGNLDVVEIDTSGGRSLHPHFVFEGFLTDSGCFGVDKDGRHWGAFAFFMLSDFEE